MDNFLLHAIVTELESLLVGGRLGKIYQMGATDLALDFRLRDGRWLVVSTDPQRLALYLTARNPKQFGDDPRSDTAFVSLVKKYAGGAELIRCEKLGYERVVKFEFAVKEEDGPVAERTLIVSLTGRAANVLIVEGGRIISTLREREGESYQDPAPPADRLDPFQISAEKFDELIAANEGDISAAAQKHLLGFSSLYANELSFRSKTRSAYDALQQLLAELFETPPNPAIYSSPSIEVLKDEIGRDEFRILLSPIELSFGVPPSGGNSLGLNIPPENRTPNTLA